MTIRNLAQSLWGGRAARAMDDLNARHPWSHNDAFHPWILTRLPERRRLAVDVGCGRGELLAQLASAFERVHGTDRDAEMRAAASARCAGLPHVTVDDTTVADLPAGADLITMIAVLHHLDLEPALTVVREKLAPGGRFLCVGLARAVSPGEQAWDLASMVTNPLIGLVRHPWVATEPHDRAPFPVADPQLSLGEIKVGVARVLPGARVRRQLGFRHTIEWTKPQA
ncbi:class I SAM-dependent methyltransferase [Arsenicicoccus dermatophilus]|uniref:class I SAM-dependent methyltransferase n=1 Tax=Arsenicicoccus dermatophilus TaxID=1076331 RepID=UPI003916E462